MQTYTGPSNTDIPPKSLLGLTHHSLLTSHGLQHLLLKIGPSYLALLSVCSYPMLLLISNQSSLSVSQDPKIQK